MRNINPDDKFKLRKVSTYFLVSVICLFIFCIPRNTSAFPQICYLLRKIELLCVAWTAYMFVKKRIYKNKWLYPMWMLFLLMVICTVMNDPEHLKDVFILIYRMFGVVVLSDYILNKDKHKGIKWIALIWVAFMLVQAYSAVTHCFGYASTSNSLYNSNYFFGIRVEINQYIIYTIAFCWFAVYTNSLNWIYAVVTSIAGVYFVFQENVSTSLMGLAIFLAVIIISKIVKSEKMWRSLIILLVVAIVIFAFVRNTQVFEWLLVGVLKEDLTLNNRTVLWQQAIEQLKGMHWLFGFGYSPPFNLRLGGTYAVNHPHNQYLQMLYNYGIGGLALYLLMVYKMVRKIRGIKNGHIKNIHMAALIATLIICITSRNYFYLTAQIYYIVVYHLTEYGDYNPPIIARIKGLKNEKNLNNHSIWKL